MTVKECIAEELGALTETQLRQVAQYVAFLKFSERSRRSPIPDEAELAGLYAEAAEEDRDLAEAGMTDYAQALAEEDAK